jgi:ADP-heptose:LPS heptosyltransferase
VRVQAKILIDQKLGVFMVWALNLLVRIAGKILRIDHTLTYDFNHIVVCKFLGLGSIIQATPLLQTLRQRYPKARITFVTIEKNRELLRMIPMVSEIRTIDDSGLLRTTISSLRVILFFWSQRPDVYIDLEIYSNFSNIIATLSLAKNRFGYFKSDKRYRMGMYSHMVYFNINAPISEVYLQFARLLHCSKEVRELQALTLPDEKRIQGNTFLQEKFNLSPRRKYIIINPNASDLRIERRWPPDRFQGLMKKILKSDKDIRIVLIGAGSEAEFVSSISSAFAGEPRVLDTSGKLNLSQLILLIEGTYAMITNDTGPLHMALAMSKRTIALFGPCSPDHYGLNDFCLPITRSVYCSPCVHEFVTPPCNGDNQCMKLISVEEVFIAYRKIHQLPKHGNKQLIAYTAPDGSPLGQVGRPL